MRVINLDETGLKLITTSKKQMYLSLEEIPAFLKENTLKENVLCFNNKKISLSEKDIIELPNVLKYIKATFI